MDSLWGKTYEAPHSQLALFSAALFSLPALAYILQGHTAAWAILPVTMPSLFVYILGPFLFPSAAITILRGFKRGDFLLIEGKKYYLKPETLQMKIFFWRSGGHKIFLVNMENEVPTISSPLKVNTYGHHIVYIEFPQNQPQSGGGSNPQATP